MLLAGATGLVGRECLHLLIDDPSVGRVVTIARRPLDLVPVSAKLDPRVVSFDRLDADEALFEADDIICALGTTIAQAGSQERFRQVDLEYPLAIARLGLARGAQHFLLVSAIGASASSRIFYNRVKGELEDAVQSMGYPSVTIARPSLLLGDRREPRFGEEVGKLFAPLIPGRWRPVQARAVAVALVAAARDREPGFRVIESDEIRRAAYGGRAWGQGPRA